MPVPHQVRRDAVPLFSVATLSAAVVMGGCQRNYRSFAEETVADVSAGKYDEAARETDAAAAKNAEDEMDRVAYMLEAGRVAQLNGDPLASDRWLNEASEIIRPYLDEKAEAKVTEAVSTTLVNQTVAEYRGTNPERTMLETLLAVNALVRGDQDSARLSLNRAYAWQQNAVQLNAEEIADAEAAKAESEAKAKEKKIDVGNHSDMVASDERFANLQDMTAYSDYADPFATYLRGVFLLFQTDPADLENSDFSFRRVAALHGTDSGAALQVAGDLELLDGQRSGAGVPPHTWVVIMEGLVPYREEFRLDIPIPVGDVNYVSAAFPYLKDRENNKLSAPEIEWEGRRYPFVEISDVGRMVKADFKQKLPTIITQEILSSALKAGATYGLKEGLGTWGQIGGIVYQAASTAADLRSWQTMPNRILVARVETPESGGLRIFDGGAVLAEVPVAPGSSGIVFVSKPSNGAVGAIQAAVLRPGAVPPQATAASIPEEPAAPTASEPASGAAVPAT